MTPGLRSSFVPFPSIRMEALSATRTFRTPVAVATETFLPSTASTSPLTVGPAAAAGDGEAPGLAAGLAAAAGAAAAGDAAAAAVAGDGAAAAGDAAAGAAGLGASVGLVSVLGAAVGAGGAPPQAASTSVVDANSAISARRVAGLTMTS